VGTTSGRNDHAWPAPGGVWLLWLITVGLGALVIWQLAEAVWDDQHLRGHRRLLGHAVHTGEAVLFTYLAYSAGKIAASGHAPSDETQTAGRDTARAAVRQVPGRRGRHRRARTPRAHQALSRRARPEHRGPGMRRTAMRLGQVGYTALGAV
jgi:hypothetical protein